VTVGARPVRDSEWHLRKTKSLFKLLALAPNHRLQGERLTETLWPHQDPEAAANNPTNAAVAGAHKKDLEMQDRYGVKHLRYWLDESTSRIFCLAEGPNKDAVIRVHREAHGLLADEVFEVTLGS
jgi:hypothetical protein